MQNRGEVPIAKLKKSGGGATIDIDFGEPNPKQVQFFMSRKLYTAYGGALSQGRRKDMGCPSESGRYGADA